MANDTLETITSMNDRIAHIEDAIMDYREILIKLVKQNNQIVKFLKEFEIEEVYDDKEITLMDKKFTISDEISTEKAIAIQDLIDKYIASNKDLKEFEKELKKHKDKITPGTVGES